MSRASSPMARPPTSAPPMPRSTCRSAAISCSTSTAITRKTDDLEIGGFVLSRDAARAGARPAPIPTSGRWPTCAAGFPTAPPETSDVAAGARLDRRRQQCRLLGQPLRQPLRRPDPLFARSGDRGGGAADRRRARPASTAAPRSTRATASSISVRLPRRLFRLSPFRARGDGEIGTTFLTRAMEGRLEVRPVDTRNGWGGGFGAQYFHRDFERRSARRNSCPPTAPASSACSRCRPSTAARSAPRPARATSIAALRADADADLGNPELRRSFDAFSGSVGASYELAPGVRFGAQRLAQRARARRPRNCSPTARMPAPRRSRSAIPTSARRRAGASRRPCAATGDGYQLRRLGLPQLVRRLYLRAADRRDPGRAAGLPISSRPTRAISASSSRARCGSARIGGVRRSTPTASPIMSARRSTRVGPGAAHPAAAAARRARGAVRPGRRPDRGRVGRRPGPDRRLRDPDRRLHDGQRLARLPPASGTRQQQRDHPVGEQHLRRRRAPPRQLPQGLCAARRPRHPDQRPLHLLIVIRSDSQSDSGESVSRVRRNVSSHSRLDSIKLTETVVVRMMTPTCG